MKPDIDYKVNEKHSAYQSNPRQQIQRAIKKSESTEGTPIGKVPITNPTKGTKISTSLKNKTAFEKFHPANKDEYSSTQHMSK